MLILFSKCFSSCTPINFSLCSEFIVSSSASSHIQSISCMRKALSLNSYFYSKTVGKYSWNTGYSGKEQNLALQKSLALKPVNLWRAVFPDYISFIILKRPWNKNNYIPFTDPYPFFHFTRNAGEPYYAIHAPYTQFICSQKTFNYSKDFVRTFLWNANPGKFLRLLITIYRSTQLYLMIIVYMVSIVCKGN